MAGKVNDTQLLAVNEHNVRGAVMQSRGRITCESKCAFGFLYRRYLIPNRAPT